LVKGLVGGSLFGVPSSNDDLDEGGLDYADSNTVYGATRA